MIINKTRPVYILHTSINLPTENMGYIHTYIIIIMFMNIYNYFSYTAIIILNEFITHLFGE